MKEVNYLWSKIDAYPDKILNLLDILDDAELAINIIINKDEDGEKVKKFKKYKEEFDDLIQKPRMAGMNIYELSAFYQEEKGRSWKDKLIFEGKRIHKSEMEKEFHNIYNTLRYWLLKAGIDDLGIGSSGKQVIEEDGENE